MDEMNSETDGRRSDEDEAVPSPQASASVTPTVGGVRIECGACPGAGGSCQDCFIGFLTSRDADDAVVFDVVEERALRALRDGGLIGTVVERRRLRPGRTA